MGSEKNKRRTNKGIGSHPETSSKEENQEEKKINFGFEFKQEEKVVDLGLDISSAVTGVVLLDTVGRLEKMDFIKLNTSKLTNIFEKADYAKEWLESNIKEYKIRNIFVEANAKMFTKGFSSADTLFTLAKMNALISYLSHKQFNAPVVDVNVTSARSRIGYKNNLKDKRPVKEKVREFVLKNYSEIVIRHHVAKTGKYKGSVVMDAEMADCIDAFVICKGGQIILSETK
jgi:hypothetical protein